MSDEFLNLRIKARTRRDAAIQAARDEYEQTLRDIEALQAKLYKQLPQGNSVSLAAAVQAVMPQDREFTVSDIMTALEARYPRRIWILNSVNNRIMKLRSKGHIVRLSRAKIGISAVYAVKGFQSSINPGADLTLAEAIRLVMVRPLTISEAVVAILEVGYRTTMPPNAFRTVVAKTLGDKGYRRMGGKWCGAA
jgi:hypothetical protein